MGLDVRCRAVAIPGSDVTPSVALSFENSSVRVSADGASELSVVFSLQTSRPSSHTPDSTPLGQVSQAPVTSNSQQKSEEKVVESNTTVTTPAADISCAAASPSQEQVAEARSIRDEQPTSQTETINAQSSSDLLESRTTPSPCTSVQGIHQTVPLESNQGTVASDASAYGPSSPVLSDSAPPSPPNFTLIPPPTPRQQQFIDSLTGAGRLQDYLTSPTVTDPSSQADRASDAHNAAYAYSAAYADHTVPPRNRRTSQPSELPWMHNENRSTVNMDRAMDVSRRAVAFANEQLRSEHFSSSGLMHNDHRSRVNIDRVIDSSRRAVTFADEHVRSESFSPSDLVHNDYRNRVNIDRVMDASRRAEASSNEERRVFDWAQSLPSRSEANSNIHNRLSDYRGSGVPSASNATQTAIPRHLQPLSSTGNTPRDTCRASGFRTCPRESIRNIAQRRRATVVGNPDDTETRPSPSSLVNSYLAMLNSEAPAALSQSQDVANALNVPVGSPTSTASVFGGPVSPFMPASAPTPAQIPVPAPAPLLFPPPLPLSMRFNSGSTDHAIHIPRRPVQFFSQAFGPPPPVTFAQAASGSGLDSSTSESPFANNMGSGFMRVGDSIQLADFRPYSESENLGNGSMTLSYQSLSAMPENRQDSHEVSWNRSLYPTVQG